MTAQQHEPAVTDGPAETPSAIRAVLAASAVPEVVAQYEAELDADSRQAGLPVQPATTVAASAIR